MPTKRTLKYYDFDEKTEKFINALQKANLVELRNVANDLFTFDKKDENDAEFNRANRRCNYSVDSPDGKTSRMFVIFDADESNKIQILNSHSWYTEQGVYCELITEIAVNTNGVGTLKTNGNVSLVFDYDSAKGKISNVRTAVEETTRIKIKNSDFSNEVKEVLLRMSNQKALQALSHFSNEEMHGAFNYNEIMLEKYNERTDRKLSLRINARSGIFVERVDTIVGAHREKIESLAVEGGNFVHKTVKEFDGKLKETYVPLKETEKTK